MFESLADQIRHDVQAESSGRTRAIRYIITALIAILVFGGLYMAVRAAG